MGRKMIYVRYRSWLVATGDVVRKRHDQGCGSGSVSGLDPDSIGSVDPDPESGSGFRRAKMTTKVEKNLKISCWMTSFAS
jgi:hypothetical protein